jgi:superfamily II DNA or RNA helicase
MQLESLTSGMALAGVEPGLIVSVVAVDHLSPGTATLVYRIPDGGLRDRLVNHVDVEAFSLAIVERPWAFNGDGESFKLAVEAKRIDLAFLFDPMMAVHTANVQPLPHQISAVYESMLPRQPLRFVLADDPGAGKTIMAGLYIRELIMRADARRILIVSPGSLTEQWRDELNEKFGLEFQVFSRELQAAYPNSNPFESIDQVIVRLDQMSRNEELQDQVCGESWDLVVFDEAHKLSAHFSGTEMKRTGRYKFAERIGAHTRHLLLMTATPHNGKEEDFQLFLALLDSDRFYGKFRDGAHKVDCSDLMRRMVKEDLVKFDGTPLFPERRAYTVNYTLSPLEAALYHAVTEYVKTEMGKAEQLEGGRKGSVGFALTALQRRLASSPEAIFQSLQRRRDRLQNRLREEQIGERGRFHSETLRAANEAGVPEDEDDLSADEQEQLEERLVDQASAAQTIAELEGEILLLGRLVQQARELVVSKQDRKWDELSRILQQDDPQTRDKDGRLRKFIIFTEHRDTLNYLRDQISGVLGNPNAVVTIHGGTHRDDRKKAQELFRSDVDVRVLVATDAAGEGVNLQNANLMVNYDLPWNPNRLEQRFGRIHRIGQQEVCHLWNLVAKETREGEVYHRLLQKLEVESVALKGRVFDILGEVFEDTNLKQLLIEAICYGDRPEVRARLWQQVDHALDHTHLVDLMNRNALAQESMSPERLFAVREEMEKAEARRLQPYFIRSFFMKAFETVGGSIYQRESGRWEVTFVPGILRERDRLITGRNRRENAPVLKRYERVCFSKEALRSQTHPQAASAVMLHPGHPLMLSLSDVILEKHANLLRQGAVLVDPSDEGRECSLLFLLTHDVKSGDGTVLSKRMQFIRVRPDGSASFAGWAPHLDLESLSEDDRPLANKLLEADWLRANFDQRALSHAAQSLVPEHFKEVSERRIAHVDKTMAAVHERLTKEISYWTDRYMKLSDDKAAGKDVRLNLENTRRTLTNLETRLETRKRELASMRHVTSAPPVVLSGAFVISAGLLHELRGEAKPPTFCVDADARSRIEQIAMDAVRKAEEAMGNRVVDVSAQKCGWDITSYPPMLDGKLLPERHIEVKGRAKGADTITVTRNEILYALNQADKFILAIVLVGEDGAVDGPHYVRNPFDVEPGWGVTSQNIDLSLLLGLRINA